MDSAPGYCHSALNHLLVRVATLEWGQQRGVDVYQLPDPSFYEPTCRVRRLFMLIKVVYNTYLIIFLVVWVHLYFIRNDSCKVKWSASMNKVDIFFSPTSYRIKIFYN